MSDREQIHPVYLDTGDGIVTVNSTWSADQGSYQLLVSGSESALAFLYPDNKPMTNAAGDFELVLQEDGYQFEDLKDVRRWLRDLMMDWRDAGANPCQAPSEADSQRNETNEDVVVVDEPSGEHAIIEDTMSTAVFGTIADVRQDAHNRAIKEKEDFSLTQIAQDQSQPAVDEDAETVAETNRSEAETAAFSTADLAESQAEQGFDTSAETVQEAATDSFQGDSERYVQEIDAADVVPEADPNQAETGEWVGSEVTMIPTGKSADPETDTGDETWDGAEVTMLPASKPSDAEADGSWDGAEQTMVGQAHDGGWDGAEQTMVGGTGSGEWDGSEQTMVGAAPGNWDGAEATVVGAPIGAEPRNESDKNASSTTSTATKTSTGTRTNPSFNDGWHLSGDPGPCTGQIWGDYEVGGKLGEGGMGTVYRGRQFSLRRRVAIKVLPPHLSSDPQMRERFELEAQSASVLNSPHVVQVFAAGTEQGNAYYVMEFVEGKDLHDVVKEHIEKEEQIDPHVAADYVIQAGRGLIEAQKHDFVHRDIKPPNLMLTKKGIVKIADFGIVKVMGESSLTMTGTAIGTPAYCSPEQGGGTGCDGRSDIYSMGVVFYELLTLQKPFDGNTGNALIYQHTYTEPKLLTDINPKCPESYQLVVLKCMQKNPDDRYQTAQELVDDLERVRLGTAPLAQVFGTGAEAMLKAKGLSRAKKWPIVVAAAAIIAVMVGGFYWYQGASERAARIDTLRKELVYLNKPIAPGEGAEGYVLELAELAGYDDVDVVRWQKKIDALSSLTASLTRLDESNEPSSQILDETVGDYDDYVSYFGSEGESAKRWQRKLNEAEVKIKDLRTQITEDLRTGDNELNVGIWDRVLPGLATLAHMAGEADTDVERWQGRYDKFKEREAALRDELKVLDADDLQLTAVDQKRLNQSLAELRDKVDERDIDVLRWRDVLAKQGASLDNMREQLAMLDTPLAQPFASQMLMADLKGTLNQYAAVVDKDDVKLLRWQKKYTDSEAAIAKHSAWFKERVEPVEGWLNLKLQIKARERFDVIRPLIPDENVTVEKWGDKLSESERITRSMQERLLNVLTIESMTKDDIARARKTIDELELIGGLEESRDSYESKLRRQENYHASLRIKLQAFNRVAPITAELQEALDEFTRLLGSEDEEGKKWRQKNAEYERLHSSLSILDQPILFKAEDVTNLEKLTGLVGFNDKDVIRWRDKVNQVRDIEKVLSQLDIAAPLPKEVQGLMETLATLVGSRDERYQLWQAKINRVAELKTNLAQIEGAYVLPQGLDKEMLELQSLVSADDSDVAKWLPIMRHLIGPKRPTWASDFGRDVHGVYADVTIDELPYRFRYIPAGKFLIGSPENQIGRDADENQVPVTLTSGYWLAEQECIQTLYAALTYENPYPSKFSGGDRPVERVSWFDAQVFLERFNERVGLNPQQARLPTEAEWEYACRAGNELASFIDAKGENTDVDQVAWFFDNANERTQSVKGRVANPLGLFDMHGNVWEWCNDNYGGYAPAGSIDPTGGAQEENVVRGGCFYDFADQCRAANRLGIDGDMQTMYVGFRIAISLDADAMPEDLRVLEEDPLQDTAEVPAPNSDAEVPEEPIDDDEPDDVHKEEDVVVEEKDLELSATEAE